MTIQYDMFEVKKIKGMVRKPSHDTSIKAAESVVDKRTTLQRLVLDAFKIRGNMTDEQLEQTPFPLKQYLPGTIRKRRTELYQMGILEIKGKSINSTGSSVKVWGLK